MEIPAQYQPQPQDGPQGGPQGGGQPQARPNDAGAARISFVQGDVSTQHGGSNDWAAATINTPVVTGDHISTGPDARAEIQLDHANVVRLSDLSTANVVNLSRNQMQLQIGQGLANYEVLSNNEAKIEIDTPNVAIHPAMGEGSYRITVNSDGETIVDVRKGSADISTTQGSTHVERDQRITIQGNADNAQYQVSGAPGRDGWDKWNSDRDHTIEGAESWRHTNPNYTGSQDLDAYGHWSDVPDYGSVWFPAADEGWAPYRDGRWVDEPSYGWTWVSYEPWGWAPYHYGRWFMYGGNWGWWPGPVYAGYEPMWAPAYVSFFGFGGGGWGMGFGFGFGGYGNMGWLPCGPGDRFYPWYGRGGGRVNGVNINNIHNNYGGYSPLRQGAYSNVDRAMNDARVRGGISSMPSNQFGTARVSMQQTKMDAGTFRQASMMTGAHPVSPSRASFQSTNRPASPSSIPNRASGSQHFYSSSNARPSGSVQAGSGAGNVNRGAGATNNASRAPFSGQASRPSPSSIQGQRGAAAPSSSSQPSRSVQSSRPGWRTFTPPSGQPAQSNSGRTSQGQAAPQSRPGYSQPSAPQSRPGYSQPSAPSSAPAPRQYQRNSSGGYNGGGSSRPTLNMQQRVMTPRGGGSYPSRAPSGGGGRGGPSGGGSRGGSSGGGSRGGNSGGGGGSRGGSSGGGSRGGNSGGGHGR